MTAEPNTSELEQAYNTVLDSHHRHWPQIPVARGLQPDYDAVVNALDMLAKAAGYDILASARIIGTFVKDGSRFDSAMGYRIGPAEPNTSMTTDQALAVLRDLEALFAARTQSEYERSVFVEADQALSVLTQEIERLTEGAEATRVAAAGEIVETTLTSETIIYPRGSLTKFRRACDWRQA